MIAASEMQKKGSQSARKVFLKEAKRIAWLSLIQIMPYAVRDVVRLSLVLLEGRKVFLDLLQCPPQSREFRLIIDRHRRTG